jgi:hypothetical protein
VCCDRADALIDVWMLPLRAVRLCVLAGVAADPLLRSGRGLDSALMAYPVSMTAMLLSARKVSLGSLIVITSFQAFEESIHLPVEQMLRDGRATTLDGLMYEIIRQGEKSWPNPDAFAI